MTNTNLSYRRIRYLTGLAFCLLIASPQVLACRVRGDTLFFQTIPNPNPDADLIAKVSLLDVTTGTSTATATAKIIEVVKTSGLRIQQGDTIAMKYKFTSCGPDHKNGEEGTIIVKTGTDSNGRLVLYPYMRGHDNGRITPPVMITK